MSRISVFFCSVSVFLLAALVVSFAAAQSPVLTSVSPELAKSGQAVTLTGSGFGATQGSSYVDFIQEGPREWGPPGKAALTITAWDDTSITFTMPNATPSAFGALTVVVGGNPSQSAHLLGEAQPVVTSISPTTAAAGQTVTVTGTNFGTRKSTNYLQFTDGPGPTSWGAPGNNATFNLLHWNNTSIAFTVPTPSGTNGEYFAHPGTTATITVHEGDMPPATTTLQIASAAGAPAITSITQSVAPGQPVTITGTNFGSSQASSFVTFTDDGTVWGKTGSTPALSIVSWSNTKIVFTMPEPSGTNNLYYVVPRSLATVTVTVAGLQSAVAQAAISGAAPTTAAVSVALNPSNAKATPIPEDFAGLSLEIAVVRSDDGGGPNLKAGLMTGTPGVYSNIVKALGVHSIRLGGASAQSPITYPTEQDANNVSDFANLVGANVLWTLPAVYFYSQPTGFPAADVSAFTTLAKSIADYKTSKGYTFQTVFAIGNENASDPNGYYADFRAYLAALKTAIGPDVQLAGPSSATPTGSFLSVFINQQIAAHTQANVAFVTAHDYIDGHVSQYSTVDQAVTAILAASNGPAFYDASSSFKSAVTAGFRPRLEETGLTGSGGYPGAANAFAGALWALDGLAYYSQTYMAGLNFHGGTGGNYSPVVPGSVSSVYKVQGVGYGMLAFNQIGHGNSIPATLTNPSSVDFTAYGVLQPDKTESVALLNKTSNISGTAQAVDINVTLTPGGAYTKAQVMYLQAPNNDPTSISGMTLGGKGFAANGTWSGTYTQTLPITAGKVIVSVPHTSAAIVHFF